MWMGDAQYRLAPALATLIGQLEVAYSSPAWQLSGQTGTIGNAAHIAEGSASDHNPWLNNTVRAFDCADLPGGPDCEQLFQMVNRLYGQHDPRVWPTGYAMYHERITDWNNPGGYRATTPDEDPHLYHCHISVSQDPAGYNSTAEWPIAIASIQQEDDMTPQQSQMLSYVYQQIRAGVARGQTGFGGTVASNLAATQTVSNQVGKVLVELQKITASTGAAK